MTSNVYLSRTFGGFTMAIGLGLSPVGAWSDHGSHSHHLLQGVVDGGKSNAQSARSKPIATPPYAQLAAVSIAERGVLNDTQIGPVWDLLDRRHGALVGDDDHRDAHGNVDNISVDSLEFTSDRAAGEKIWLAQAQVGNATGTPDQIGQWSGVIGMPVIPIFTALLPSGKVLMWDSVGDGPTESFPVHDFTRAAVWDPIANTSTRIDVSGFNIFCAGFVHMADGKVFVAGGNKDSALNGIRQTHIFDFNTNSWGRGPDMAYERWYPSVAALANSEHFVMGGGPDTHEVRQTNNTMRTLTGAVLAHGREYPFIQLGLDGRVIYAGPQSEMRLIDTNGVGSIQSQGNRDGLYRSYGSYAMYDVGKLIVTGGASSTNTATLVNMASNALTASATSSMKYGRRQHNATVLADGSVLVTGGLSSGAGLVDLSAGVFAAEVWNPATSTWKELASAAVTRQYHSVAMLLPDGRVYTGGGGICGVCQQVGYLRKDAEIFSPPYLFKKDGAGQLASRPAISSAQPSFGYGQGFNIVTPQAGLISKVALVRLGAPTHGQDQGQRYIPLNFSINSGSLTATSPANANIAPPGYYMLFIVDSNGVPSVSKMVKVANIAPLKGSGKGLTGQYFNNITLTGSGALQRAEAINFNWGVGVPGTGIGVDRFSVRWTGQVQAPLTGSYQFQTNSDDGVRVSLNGQQIIDNWTDHGPTINISAAISLSAGIKYNITVEYYENTGGAVASLSWKLPASASFGIVPADRLYAASPPVISQFASTLVAKHSGQCLEVPGNSVTQGIALLQNICNGANAQLFDFIPVAGSLEIYTLKNRNSGLCADIENASLDNRAPLVQSACNGSNSQKYLLTPNTTAGAKAFQVLPQHTGKCVDVSGALQTIGARVQQWDCWSGSNQIWTIGGKP